MYPSEKLVVNFRTSVSRGIFLGFRIGSRLQWLVGVASWCGGLTELTSEKIGGIYENCS